MMELIGLAVSPYSLKAKWALDHHRIAYKYSEHLLIFGAPLVRFKLRKWCGDFTVPALIDGHTRLMDSFEIAEYADQIGPEAKLFPGNKLEEIAACNVMSEAICDAGRALVTLKVGKNKEALVHLVPPMPELLRKIIAFISPIGISYLNAAFNLDAVSPEERENALRRQLTDVRALLARNGGKYLLGTFTYADIAVASALQMVKPHSDSFVAKNEATRQCWTQERIANEFPDLLQWRDKIYLDHYPAKQK